MLSNHKVNRTFKTNVSLIILAYYDFIYISLVIHLVCVMNVLTRVHCIGGTSLAEL